MKLDNVADIYPLSPLQLGMLFHTLAEPESGVYVSQLVIRLRGPVDSSILSNTWSALAQRHAVLRTAFLWDGLDEPMQVVRERVETPWSEDDWSNLDSEVIRKYLLEFLAADRQKGFDLSRAPLFRLQMIHYGRDSTLLVWSYHHILLDGWSTFILLDDLRALYSEAVEDRRRVLDEPFLFRAYIEHTRSKRSDDSHEFWKNLLGDFSEPTPLGIDRTSPPGSGGSIQASERVVPSKTARQITEFARTRRVTMSTVVHAAWSLLLGFYSGRRDVVYGFTITDRPAAVPGIEKVVGLCINTLPVRIQITPDLTVRQWILDLQEQLIEIQGRSETPLFETKRLSAVPGERPLFDSILVFENYPVGSLKEPYALEIEDVEHFEQSNFPIALLFLPDDPMRVKIMYDSGRFAAEDIETLLRQFEIVLDRVSSEENSLVRDVQLPPEELSILRGPHAAEATLPVHQQLLRTASIRPDAIAVSCDGGQMSYGDLARRSASIAARLANLGLQADEPVCLVLNRSTDMIAAMIGVLRAGGAYVPIDPDAPDRRVEKLVEDCRARLIIESSGSDRQIDNRSLTRIIVEEIQDDAERYVDPNTAPSDRAYILYTSGSTGQPKGVEVTHENLSSSTAARADYYQDSPKSFLLLSSYVFDSSVAGIFSTLCSGGKLVVPQPRLEQNVEALARLIQAETITHTLCLPSLYRLILKFADPSFLASLKTVIVAGEPCPPSVIRHHFTVLPDAKLYNEYGPTEATVWATVEQFEDANADVSIGRPIRGMSVYVCSDDLRPVPIGVAGEILLGGPGIAKGYVNRPEHATRSFVSCVETAGGSPLYRTGDIGRIRPDGRLEYLGRIDGQLKIRGYRIEPEEIENVIVGHKLVREVAVVAVNHSVTEQRFAGHTDRTAHQLVAFLAPSEPSDPRYIADQLRTYAESRLPAYMVPSQYVQVDELPRTASGKIDRKTLADETTLPQRFGDAKAEPQNEQEMILLDVWKKVLGTECIRLDDSFFEIGGDSIRSIEMLSLARQRGLTLPLSVLFGKGTIREMAAMAGGTELKSHDNATRTLSISPIRTEGPLPPLFLIHGVSSNVLHYANLVEHLSTDLPVYAIQGQGLAGARFEVESLSDLGRIYSDDIVAMGLEAPHVVLAYCVGGNLALELAAQLQLKGVNVPLVVMIDALAPNVRPEKPALLQKSLHAVRGGPIQAATAALRYGRALLRIVWRRLQFQLASVATAAGVPVPQGARTVYVSEMNKQIIFDQTPRKYEGDLVLVLRSAANPDLFGEAGWRDFVEGPIETLRVEGSHDFLTDAPDVAAELAQAIQTRIDRLHRGT
ncbi:MAG: amino acid adenylation domain-containing protein [Rhodothermales bacterium]|nr:amino acid adenylation domain-containing protein [Rhodothermales bacterium]